MINVQKLQFKTFPGGELHLIDNWINDGSILQDNTILCRIQQTDDLMKLCLFVDGYKRFTGRTPYKLVLPYIPYARQDRVANPGESLSIKVFSNILNSLNFRQVTVLDPHSDVCTALIDNLQIIPQWDIFADCIMDDVDLISPDAGALKKVTKLQNIVKERYNIDVPIRLATKHRNTKTGELTDTKLDGKPTNKTAVIIDDICDSGGTCVSLAKVIKTQYDKIILMITHGIFSTGFDELSLYFSRILSTNSWNGELKSQGILRVIPVEKLL